MSKLIRIGSIILLVFSISDFVMAQNRTVVEVEVAENDGSKKNKMGVRNLIKLNPILFLRGDIPIYYERALTDRFSVELGLGMTIRDYISSLTTLYGEVYQQNVSIKPKLGFSFNAGARYYPSNYVYQPEGIYFGVDYRFQRYNATVVSVNSVPKDIAISEANNDVRLLLGHIHYFEENVFLELYSGFGIRHKVYDKITVDENNAFNSVSISSANFMLPYLSLGFKVGLAF